MGIFSKPELPVNLSGSGEEFKDGSPLPWAVIPKNGLKSNHSCVFLLGPMSRRNGKELLVVMEEQARNMRGYNPEEICWTVEKILSADELRLPNRHFTALENYRLYQARLKTYDYFFKSDIIKAAQTAKRKGNPLEFTYSSKRTEDNSSVAEYSSHTVLVKRIHEDGFVGMTALGPRRFSWQRVEAASLLEGGNVLGEKAIRLEFHKDSVKRGKLPSFLPEQFFENSNPRITIALGEHLGKGQFSYAYPHFATHDVGYGNS